MESIAAVIVVIVCFVIGQLGLCLVRDKNERRFLSRLFLTAFVVRLSFTVACYATGLINVLGGADDTGWTGIWARSQQWKVSGIESIGTIFNFATIKANPGYAYFASLFFYFLDIRSQIALSCFHCFLNAMTVVVIYKVAREFFSQKASTFAAWVAVFMPSFLIWSALTIKETWLIMFEILTCLSVTLLARRRGPAQILFLLTALLCITLSLSFRFYVAWFLVPGAITVFICCRSQRPFISAGFSLAVVTLLFVLLQSLGIVQFDLAHIAQAQLGEIATFRQNISDPRQLGTNSGVLLDYDIRTPTGSIMMLLVGGTYLLLSPFPWQLSNLRQVMALPDILLWWWLVFGFIVPGFRYAWRHQPAILLSIIAFVLPLLVFYSLMFGNVGLAYRQRAQLMPFFLILAAAGYESRQRQLHPKRRNLARLSKLLLQSTETTRSTSSSVNQYSERF